MVGSPTHQAIGSPTLHLRNPAQTFFGTGIDAPKKVCQIGGLNGILTNQGITHELLRRVGPDKKTQGLKSNRQLRRSRASAYREVCKWTLRMSSGLLSSLRGGSGVSDIAILADSIIGRLSRRAEATF